MKRKQKHNGNKNPYLLFELNFFFTKKRGMKLRNERKYGKAAKA